MVLRTNKFYNFQLNKIDKKIPTIDYNKFNRYSNIWKDDKNGFGNSISNLKNTRNKIENQIQSERKFNFKSILNNFNRNFHKKLIDTIPPKSLYNPPIYYNYLNSSKLSKPNNFKLTNYSEERRINNIQNNKDNAFDDYDKINIFKQEDKISHLNESYLFFKRKNNKHINPLIKIFNKDIKIKKRELNSLFKQRINMIKNNSMRELKIQKIKI